VRLPNVSVGYGVDVRFPGKQSATGSSLFDPEKIDVVMQGRHGEANLYIVQDQPWRGTGEETQSLKQKLDNYVTFAVGGQMHEMYPQLRGERWKIVIDSYVGPPNSECWSSLSARGDAIRNLGGDLIVHEMLIPTPPDTIPPTVRARRVGQEWPDGQAVDL
jgi:hypothetical protein